MSNVNDVKDKVKATSGLVSIESMIKKSVVSLGEALPSHMNSERLVRIALTTLRLNPELYKCTPQSFMGALFQSAQLGLEPNVEGQAYIIPFNNSRKDAKGKWSTVKEAQFQIGYKGYVELFYRHKNAISLDMHTVYSEDGFNHQYGSEAKIIHSPVIGRDRGSVVGFYAIAKMSHGAQVFTFMSLDECLDHGKKHSKCFDKKENKFYSKTPWDVNPNAMCLKTVLIQLMKLLPKSIELQRAISADETIKTTVESDMIDVKDETEWIELEDELEIANIAQQAVIAGTDEPNAWEIEAAMKAKDEKKNK